MRVFGQDGTLVTGKPFFVTVLSTHVAAKYCALTGSGLEQVVAGEGGSFEITATDRHGNLCEVAPHLGVPASWLRGAAELRLNTRAAIHDAAIRKLGRFLRTDETVLGGEVSLLARASSAAAMPSPARVSTTSA